MTHLLTRLRLLALFGSSARAVPMSGRLLVFFASR